MSDQNGFVEYKKLLLHELDKHSQCLEGIERAIQQLRVDVEGLKIKASIWGLLGGLLPGIGILLVLVIKWAVR